MVRGCQELLDKRGGCKEETRIAEKDGVAIEGEETPWEKVEMRLLLL